MSLSTGCVSVVYPISSRGLCHCCALCNLSRTKMVEPQPQSPPASAPADAPQLRITDARCTGYTHTDRTREWRLLSIDAINTTLAAPITQLDTRLNTHTGPESILTKGEVAQLLPPHLLRFPIATHASEPAQLSLLLRNASAEGRLRVSFSLPTALPSYLTLPTWVSAPSQSPLGRYHQSLIEHKVFGVPSEAVLIEAGQSVTVCFTYHHQSVGVHSLPVVLEVADGKWLTLVLEGETVAREDEVVEDMRVLQQVTRDEYHTVLDRLSRPQPLPITACFTHTLAAQPIHLTTSQAPVQLLPLYNDGPSVLQYRLDKVDNNMTDGIWRMPSPTGTIEPYSTTHIAIRYRPTQPRPYELLTLLTVSGGSRSGGEERQYALLLKAGAVMPDAMSGLQFPLPLQLPAVQSMLRPGQLARLSCDVVSFDGMPCHSLLARVFVLYSLSSRPLAFALSAADTLASLVTLTPSTGRIEAGGHVVVKVELRGGQGESVYVDASVTCTVNVESDTTLRRHYKQQREASPTAPHRHYETDEDDEGDIVLASSNGRFSVNHSHTLQRIHGNALRFPTHPPIASRLTRQQKAVPAAVRLNALGVSGRVEEDKRRKARVGKVEGREEKEREEEQRVVMDGMERAYSQLHQASPHQPTEVTASRNSDTLQLRVLARLLPLSLLEEEELQRVRQARLTKQEHSAEEKEQQPQPVLASEVRRDEEQAIAHWRQQFYFPPLSATSHSSTTIPTTAAEQQQSIARLVHDALYGRVVDAAFSELLPARPARWDEVKRRLAGEVAGKAVAQEEKDGPVEEDEARERRVWERREQLEAEMMDKVRALVAEQPANAKQ